MTVRMYVRHHVTDFAAWRKVYDAFDAKRREMGVTGQAVYRSIDDANDVTVTHDFTNAAKAFASSPDLKAAMENAGVKGTPQIWLTTRAEQRKRQR
jgi:hypothetical protein